MNSCTCFFSKRFEQYKASFLQCIVVVQHCIFNISTRSDAGNLCVGDCGQDEGFHLDKTGSCLEFEICSLDLVDFLCPAILEEPNQITAVEGFFHSFSQRSQKSKVGNLANIWETEV